MHHKPLPMNKQSDHLPLADQGTTHEADALYAEVRAILEVARNRAVRSVNVEMVRAYWAIGHAIVEREQAGKGRAGYGEQIIVLLSKRLGHEFGRGFTSTNLKYMRQFYLAYPKGHALRDELSWTHYRLLMRVDKPEARAFYEEEATRGRWSTRELERQVNSLFFERAALSSSKQEMLASIEKSSESYSPQEFVKDPYVLEFLNLPQSPDYNEADLESALIAHLQEFLLELGRGFAFVGRQQRLTIDGDHFYVDLVFYNRLLKCFVLIDLKVGKLTHQDLGQMQLYVNYYTREMLEDWENPTIGILLCADKNDTVVKYTLPEGQRQIFASRYQLQLPSEEELVAELRREQEALTLRKSLNDPDQKH